MSAYQEWAKRNWPTATPAANDPDRFVEFSQADLDAYAEKAFAAGRRSPRQQALHEDLQLAKACARLNLREIDALSFRLEAYRVVAGLGWACAVGAAWYWG